MTRLPLLHLVLWACAVDCVSTSQRQLATNTSVNAINTTAHDTTPYQHNLAVCRCDGMGTCEDDSIMAKEDVLFLCISTIAESAVAHVESLAFHQYGLVQSTIFDGKPQDDHTWVVKSNSTMRTIRTRVDRDFFKPSFRATKRQSLMAKGIVMLESNAEADYEVVIPLKQTRLMVYGKKHVYLIAFGTLVVIFICVWAAVVAVASDKSYRTEESLTPEKLVEIEEKRLTEIYTIWYQSERGKQSIPNVTLSITESSANSSARHVRRSVPRSAEEEKVEIDESYDDESVVSLPSMYAGNRG